jgi:hypothetical protein
LVEERMPTPPPFQKVVERIVRNGCIGIVAAAVFVERHVHARLSPFDGIPQRSALQMLIETVEQIHDACARTGVWECCAFNFG